MKTKRGFTLIELLVVIAIIAVIAGLVIVRIGSAAADARDSRRKSDLNIIKKAMEQFKIYGGSIKPCPGAPAACDRPLTLTNDPYLDGGNPQLFNPTSTGKYPSDFINGGDYPRDPIRKDAFWAPDEFRPYWIRLKDAAANLAPNTSYIIVAAEDTDQEEILVPY